jgi:hypothetical protein
MIVEYEIDRMNVGTRKYQNKQKEWRHATKPLKKIDHPFYHTVQYENLQGPWIQTL